MEWLERGPWWPCLVCGNKCSVAKYRELQGYRALHVCEQCFTYGPTTAWEHLIKPVVA